MHMLQVCSGIKVFNTIMCIWMWENWSQPDRQTAVLLTQRLREWNKLDWLTVQHCIIAHVHGPAKTHKT